VNVYPRSLSAQIDRTGIIASRLVESTRVTGGLIRSRVVPL
jgi:hypothetical protein